MAGIGEDDLMFLDDDDVSDDFYDKIKRGTSASGADAGKQPTDQMGKLAKRPSIEDDDVIEQGKGYNGPELSGSGSGPQRGERRTPTKRERPVKEKKPVDWSKYSKVFLIGGLIIVAAIVIGVLAVVSEKRKAEEEQKHIDELMSQIDSEEEEEDEMYAVVYTSSEIEELRLNGYTGTEIEEFQVLGYEAEDMIKDAEKARQKKYKKELEPFFEGASEEFLELYNYTWFGLDDLEVLTDTENYTYRQTTLNLDYEKVDPKGLQLMVKLWLNEEKYVFMVVEPARWLELAKAGNMVVKIDYVEMSDGKLIVTDITEIKN